LAPDVVFRVDPGPNSPLARGPITGAPAVARQVLARGARFAPLARHARVNGALGLVVGPQERPIAVVGMTVVGGRITSIDLVTDPAKLRHVAS
jgi:RNA polymerase sigma-70 factor, ECF subfamily